MKFSSLNEMKKWIVLILVGVFAFWGLNNFSDILDALTIVYKVFFPFIFGGALAFVLNIPMVKIEKWLKKVIKTKNKTNINGGIRAISIVLSLIFFILIIGAVAFLLIPELIENIELLMKNIPILIDKAEVFALDLMDKYPEVQVEIKEMFAQNGNVSGVISSILNYFINGAIGFISNIFSGFVSIFTGVIFSIYMLSQKEYLLGCGKKLIYAYMNKRKADKTMDILALTNKTFSKFISGQCVEAIILGSIIFVVSVIAGFPYALLIATFTTITALIPIFGSIIALVVGAILICISNPIQAVIFAGLFILIQQIEGNVIYPKVVGKSVGLSPLWTLLAVTVGGNLFGIIGMLVGLPLASVVYTLIKENVKIKLTEKKMDI